MKICEMAKIVKLQMNYEVEMLATLNMSYYIKETKQKLLIKLFLEMFAMTFVNTILHANFIY